MRFEPQILMYGGLVLRVLCLAVLITLGYMSL
jgi:hypothetical protein